jgi:stage III sporulation protein AF
LEQIGDWLKGVVVVLLFVAFVDQILPANGLQRYVKMTLRLIVFVTLLSPIFRFFDMPMDWNQRMFASATTVQQMTPLSQILEQANQLRLSRENQAVTWAQTELEKQIKERLSSTSQRIVNQVNVVVIQKENGQLAVETIAVQLGPKVSTALIQPIEIDLKAMGGIKDDSKSMQEMKQWQKWIEKNWGQPHTSVSVKLVE